MKKTLLYYCLPFILCIGISLPNIQAQSLLENEHWLVYFYDFGGTYTNWVSKGCEVEFGGKVYQSVNYPGTEKYYLREGDNKIFVYIPDDGQEYVMIDYNQSVGTTIPLYNPNAFAGGWVDAELLSISTDPISGNPRYSYEAIMPLDWIVGLGSKYGPVTPPITTDPDWGLGCVVDDGTVVYSSSSSDCNDFPTGDGCFIGSLNVHPSFLSPTSARLDWDVGYLVSSSVIWLRPVGGIWETSEELFDQVYVWQDLTPNTEYEWKVTGNCCLDPVAIESEIHTFTTPMGTSLSQISEKENKPYFNINNHTITIGNLNPSITNLELYDVNGRLLMRKKISNGGNHRVEIEVNGNLPKGILFCRLFDDRGASFTLKGYAP